MSEGDEDVSVLRMRRRGINESIKIVNGRRESVDRWKDDEWKWTEFKVSFNLNIVLNAISGPYWKWVFLNTDKVRNRPFEQRTTVIPKESVSAMIDIESAVADWSPTNELEHDTDRVMESFGRWATDWIDICFLTKYGVSTLSVVPTTFLIELCSPSTPLLPALSVPFCCRPFGSILQLLIQSECRSIIIVDIHIHRLQRRRLCQSHSGSLRVKWSSSHKTECSGFHGKWALVQRALSMHSECFVVFRETLTATVGLREVTIFCDSMLLFLCCFWIQIEFWCFERSHCQRPQSQSETDWVTESVLLCAQQRDGLQSEIWTGSWSWPQTESTKNTKK